MDDISFYISIILSDNVDDCDFKLINISIKFSSSCQVNSEINFLNTKKLILITVFMPLALTAVSYPPYASFNFAIKTLYFSHSSHKAS